MAVEFTKQCGKYAAGDKAVFTTEHEAKLVRDKFAKIIDEGDAAEKRDPSANQDRQTTVGGNRPKGK